jgi:hypothetical protein
MEQGQERLSRRMVTRMLAGGALTVVSSGLLIPHSAQAGISWCRTDPLITVNGATGHVYVESIWEMFEYCTGPVKINVDVPKGADASAEPLDNGFGRGYNITFSNGNGLKSRGPFTDVRISARVPCQRQDIPVRVYFHSDDKPQFDATVYGVANEWIHTGAVKI